MNDDPYAPSKAALPFTPDLATRAERTALSLILWANALSSGFLLLTVAAASVSFALDVRERGAGVRTLMVVAASAAALSLWGSVALWMRRRRAIPLLLPMLAPLGFALARIPDPIKLGWFCLHLWFVFYSIILWRRGCLR